MAPLRDGLSSALILKVSLSNMVFCICFPSHSLGVQLLHPPTYNFSLSVWERYLIWRLITCCLGVRYMKEIKTVWTCGTGSNLDMRVWINWIPSGNSMERKLGRFNLSTVGRLATTSNDSRVWQFCGDK